MYQPSHLQQSVCFIIFDNNNLVNISSIFFKLKQKCIFSRFSMETIHLVKIQWKTFLKAANPLGGNRVVIQGG